MSELAQCLRKKVGCAPGQVFDLALDVLRDSTTLWPMVGLLLGDVTYHQLCVPPGFAHGFFVRSEVADFYINSS